MIIEHIILSNLVKNENFSRKVAPYIKEEYFSTNADRVIFNIIYNFIDKYNDFPTKEALSIELENSEKLTEQIYQDCQKTIDEIWNYEENTKIEWLFEKAEKWCQDRAIYNALMTSVKIIDNNNKLTKDAIPQILSDALGVSFDSHIGHSFLEDADARYDFYHTTEVRIPFDLEYLNLITAGGLPKKTLNIIIGPTGGAKTLTMCHMAAANLMNGRNVLYITLEMAEERIAERIDANLLDVTLDDLKYLTKDVYQKRIARIKEKTGGKLIIHEYPTASAGSANFRHLLNELKIKQNFIPDIIYIDYINICMSSRIKLGGTTNSYTYIKTIAEELRGLAVEQNLPIVSATQVNRQGFCLALDTKVIVKNDGVKDLIDVNRGDYIKTINGWNKVTEKFNTTKKIAYKITTKSGKTIICSNQHNFPTTTGEKNISSGLKIGDTLFVTD